MGSRKIKKIILNKILELIHPNPNANFIQSHSIPFAKAGIKTETMPITKLILVSTGI
jgi:hypothetical protein